MNVLNLFYQSSVFRNRVYDRWTQSHLPFDYHSYGSNQQGGFCPKGILSILWRGFCPPCKNHEGDYVHPVKSFKGEYVHLVKNMGISSTYAKMSRGDFVRGGFCPTLPFQTLLCVSCVYTEKVNYPLHYVTRKQWTEYLISNKHPLGQTLGKAWVATRRPYLV